MMDKKAPCSKKCKDSQFYIPELKGRNADNSKIIFVLHRPSHKILQKSLFGFTDDYFRALNNSETGKCLQKIIERSNLGFEDIYLTNVFKCFLTDDRNPTQDEYNNCLSIFEKQVDKFSPRKIVVFGQPAYNLLFPRSERSQGNRTKEDIFEYKRIEAIAAHHPSTTWLPDKERYYREISSFLKR